MFIIDSHQHFWDIERKDCSWPTPDLDAIYRTFAPPDYREITANLEVRGSVLVQSQACDSDTDYLLGLAEKNEDILAVVGWVDLASAEASNRIRTLAAREKLRGLRPMLQSIEDSDWILGKNLQKGVDVMLESDLRFDALIQPRHLSAISEFAKRNSDLQIVVDHGAKPDIANNEFSIWSKAMGKLAELPNVCCKLSGLLTEASQAQVALLDVFVPYVKHLVSCFGAQRLMWGSDWPVVNLVSSLPEWLHSARELLLVSHVSEKELPLIFSDTARRFYRLNI